LSRTSYCNKSTYVESADDDDLFTQQQLKLYKNKSITNETNLLTYLMT